MSSHVEIDVEDQCGGLPPGKANELFNAFQQRGKDAMSVVTAICETVKGTNPNSLSASRVATLHQTVRRRRSHRERSTRNGLWGSSSHLLAMDTSESGECLVPAEFFPQCP
jgi:hypothetical protein